MLKKLLGATVLALIATIAQAASIVQLPKPLVVDINGAPRVGAQASFFVCGSSTPLPVYTTAAIASAHTQPVESGSTGLFPAMYLPANVTCYKLTLQDADDVLIYTEDNIPAGGSVLWPLDVTSFGVTADSQAARTANCTALEDLLDASSAGPEGRIAFPNASGTTTYYFGACSIDIRDGITLDLNGSTLDFSGSYDVALNTHGFLEAIRDVAIVNGTINVDYDGSAGTNNGIPIRLGSRNGYAFGADADGVEDEDLSVPMGNLELDRLKIITNNPGHAVIALGGIEGLRVRNVTVDGGAAATSCFYYEFGFWHYEATAANIESSHAKNVSFQNDACENLGATGIGLGLTGVMSASVDGWTQDGGLTGIAVRAGEALYYKVGDRNAPAGTGLAEEKPHVSLRNVVIKDVTGTGLALTGAELATGGYLAAVVAALDAEPEAKAQTDQISFSVDTCSIEAGGAGMNASGPVTVSNCDFFGAATSGQVILTDEATRFEFDNVRVLGSSGIGVRASFGSAVWSPARPKRGSIRNSLVAGNTAQAMSFGNANGVLIDNVRCGYVEAMDDLTESTQTTCVNVQSTALNVTARGIYVSGIASGSAFVNASSGGWKYNKIEGCSGTCSTSGQWTIDGFGMDADIGDANTTLDPGVDLPFQRYSTTLTANRTVTLGTCDSSSIGARYRVTRNAGTPGAFTLAVGSAKTIGSNTAAFVDVQCDGSSWILMAYGAL